MGNGNQAVLTVGAKSAAGTAAAFAAVSKGFKAIAAGMREQAKALAEMGKADAAKALLASANATSNLSGQITKNVNVLKKLTEEEEKATGKAERRLKTIKRIKKGLAARAVEEDKAAQRLKKLADELARAAKKSNVFERAVKRLGKSFKTYLSYTIVSSALIQVRQAFSLSTAVIIDYDQALHDLQAITQATADETVQMGLKITDVATKTKFSLSEVADGMKTLGQAGFTASESIAAIQGVSDLATGTLTEIKTTVDLVSTALRVFKLEFSDASHVADVFANAVNGSKLTIDKLRTSFNYIGPIAKLSGVSFESLTATMMSLANQGIRASTIGTGLRQVFSRLVKPTNDFKNAILNAGFSLEELNPKYNDMEDIIDRLKLVVVDAGKAFQFFGRRGSAAVAALVEAGSDEFLKMERLVQRTGIAAEMAATQMEGLGISFKNLRDRLGVLAKELGEAGLAGVLRVFIMVAKPLVILLTAIVNNGLAPVIINGIAATAAIAGLVSVIQLLAGSKWVVAMFAAMNGTLIGTSVAAVSAATGVTALRVAMLALPWGWIAVGIGLVTAGLSAFLGASDRAANSLDKQIAAQRNLQEQLKSASKELDIINELGLTDVEIRNRQEKIVLRLIDGHEELAGELVDNIHNTEGLATVIDKLHQSISDEILSSYFEKMLLKIDLYDELVKKASHYQRVMDTLASGRKTIYTPYSEDKLKLIKSVSIKAQSDLEGLVKTFARVAALLNKAGMAFDDSALRANKSLWAFFKVEYDKLFEKAEVKIEGDASSKADEATKRLAQARLDLLKFQSKAQFLTKDEETTKVGKNIEWGMPWGDLVQGAGEALDKEIRTGLLKLQEKLKNDPAYKETLVNVYGTKEELELYFAFALKKFERFAAEKNRMEQRLIGVNKDKIIDIERENVGGGAQGEFNIITAKGVEELRQAKVKKDVTEEQYRRVSELQALVNSDSEATSIIIQDSLDNMRAAALAYKQTLTSVGTANTEANLAITKEHVKQQIRLARIQGRAYETANGLIDQQVAAGEKLVHVAEKEKLVNKENAFLIKESTIHNANIVAEKLKGTKYARVQYRLDKGIQKVTADIAGNTADITDNKKEEAAYTASILSLTDQLQNLQARGEIDKDLYDVSKAGKESVLIEEKRLQDIAALKEKALTENATVKNKIDLQIKILEQQGRNDKFAADQRDYQSRLAMLNDWRERVKLTQDEINQIYLDAAVARVITQQEAHDRMVEQTGTLVERLKLRWDEYLGTRKTDEEELADIMEEAGNRGVDAVVDSLMELENGTKSAAEQFKSMTLSILKDVQRMILKMLIFAAIRKIAGFAMGGGTSLAPAGSGPAIWANPDVPRMLAHSGKKAGSWGNVTRAIGEGFAAVKHSGVGSDERLAILRKNESVLTPSQMKSTGGGGDVYITNEVNVPVDQSKDKGDAELFGSKVANLLEASMTKFVVNHKRPGGLFSNA